MEAATPSLPAGFGPRPLCVRSGWILAFSCDERHGAAGSVVEQVPRGAVSGASRVFALGRVPQLSAAARSRQLSRTDCASVPRTCNWRGSSSLCLLQRILRYQFPPSPSWRLAIRLTPKRHQPSMGRPCLANSCLRRMTVMLGMVMLLLGLIECVRCGKNAKMLATMSALAMARCTCRPWPAGAASMPGAAQRWRCSSHAALVPLFVTAPAWSAPPTSCPSWLAWATRLE